MSRRAQIAIIAAMALLFCCLVGATAGVLVWPSLVDGEPGLLARTTPTQVPVATPVPFTPTVQPSPTVPESTGTPVPTPTPVPPTPTYTPPPPPPPPSLTPGSEAASTEGRLLATELPQRDMRLLAERLRKTGPIPEIVHETPPTYQLGDSTEFWVNNVDTLDQFRVRAVLRYATPHLYMWVEEGLGHDQEALARSAERFESHTYPTVRGFFGSEWRPGVDSDTHLHVLHSTAQHMGRTVAGYYSSADEYSRLANLYSNEREMFYISLSGLRPGTEFYDGVLAHEFQHMVHWANDRNEETWVNEGLSELAAYVSGYDPGGFDWVFVSAPDKQLTTWPEGGSAGAHYGCSYLFMAYFYGRFGEETMQRVVAHPANGVRGFDAVLAEYDLTFDDVFADWVVANYVDNLAPSAGQTDRRYTYPDHAIGPASTDVRHDRYPVQRQSTVHQYAADYIELAGQGDLLISFTGDTEARLVPVEAHSGQYAWWSNRGDDSDATLTHAFDLRTVDSATLEAWVWYEIEEDWDYAYVEASADGGVTWDVLSGPSSTTSNPNGNSYGPAYTGRSNGWVQETFDLSPYAGSEVLVRFEYVTDDAVNLSGWLIDDVRVPELGFQDDVEAGPGEWQAGGFVYSGNRVPQRFLVQLVTLGEELQVLPLPIDGTGTGSVELRGLGSEFDSAVLVVSALAPVTTEVASYEYAIQPVR